MDIPEYTRLKNNRDFGLVFRRGQYYPGRHVVLHANRSGAAQLRLGVAVSRKVRGAVLRNRLKRRLREAFRRLDVLLPNGYDLILTAKATAAKAPFDELQNEIKGLLARSKLLVHGR
ncbi:MAG TPA: ribonuclease P protein component [Clostridiaceae bacterium]|jgi:ribonuclease P protein component|nr:ribonuclease P protein component [Clostridiaceae bacterium]